MQYYSFIICCRPLCYHQKRLRNCKIALLKSRPRFLKKLRKGHILPRKKSKWKAILRNKIKMANTKNTHNKPSPFSIIIRFPDKNWNVNMLFFVWGGKFQIWVKFLWIDDIDHCLSGNVEIQKVQKLACLQYSSGRVALANSIVFLYTSSNLSAK